MSILSRFLVLALAVFSYYGFSQPAEEFLKEFSEEAQEESLFDQDTLNSLGEDLAKSITEEGPLEEYLPIDQDSLNSAGETFEKLGNEDELLFKTAVVFGIEASEAINEALGFDHLDAVQARVIALPAWIGFLVASYHATGWALDGLSKVTPEQREIWKTNRAYFRALRKELEGLRRNSRVIRNSLSELKKSFDSDYVRLSRETKMYHRYAMDPNASQLFRNRWGAEALELARRELQNPNLTLGQLNEIFINLKNQSSKIKADRTLLRTINKRIKSVVAEIKEGMTLTKPKSLGYRAGRAIRSMGSFAILGAGAAVWTVLTADLLLIEFSSIEEMSRLKEQYKRDLSFSADST